MVMSELTGGVDGAGLLVFLGCSMKGRYIDPDQQGDSRVGKWPKIPPWVVFLAAPRPNDRSVLSPSSCF